MPGAMTEHGGCGAALTWRATLADPALPALLLATEEGRPVYEQISYLALFRFTLWSRDRPDGMNSAASSTSTGG